MISVPFRSLNARKTLRHFTIDIYTAKQLCRVEVGATTKIMWLVDNLVAYSYVIGEQDGGKVCQNMRKTLKYSSLNIFFHDNTVELSFLPTTKLFSKYIHAARSYTEIFSLTVFSALAQFQPVTIKHA